MIKIDYLLYILVAFILQNKKDLLILESALPPVNVVHIDGKLHL